MLYLVFPRQKLRRVLERLADAPSFGVHDRQESVNRILPCLNVELDAAACTPPALRRRRLGLVGRGRFAAAKTRCFGRLLRVGRFRLVVGELWISPGSQVEVVQLVAKAERCAFL